MAVSNAGYRKTAIDPMDCFREGWEMLRGQYWQFVVICFVGMFLGGVVPFGLLMGPMICGVYACFFQCERGEAAAFDTLFKGFDFFGPSLLAFLVLGGISILAAMVLFAITVAGLLLVSGAAPLVESIGTVSFFVFAGFGLCVFVTLILFVSSPFIFVFELIVDKGMPPFAAFTASRKAVMANLSGVLGLVLLSLVLSSAGVLLCYVGSILVTPLLFAAQTAAYRKLFPSQ